MRKTGTKNLNGEKPWEKYGLTRSCYYTRMWKGLPFDKDLRRGCKNGSGRVSGRVYENPPGRLEEIRRKYAGGVTEEIMSEFEQKLKNGF